MDSLTIHFFCVDISFFKEGITISDLMINEQIRDKEVRLIGANGEQLGIMSTRDAMKIAREANLTEEEVCAKRAHMNEKNIE